MLQKTAILCALLFISAHCIPVEDDNKDKTDAGNQGVEMGEHRCATCPDSDIEVFERNAGNETTTTLDGTITDAEGDGTFRIEGANGEQIEGEIPTDPETGEFSVTVPLFCGEQTVTMTWNNANGELVVVVSVTTTECVDADIRVTLFWDDLGRDWELHLLKPGGQINDDVTDCTWTTCVGSSPDWGQIDDPSDDPSKDVDNTGTYGPENIYLSKPEQGTYTVMVEHWGAGDPSSDGYVIINIKGHDPVRVEIQDLISHHVWTAATIAWPSGTVTPSQEKYDCTGDWSGGCNAAIP